MPLNIEIRETSDAGTPIVASAPTSEVASVYKSIAARVAAKLSDLAVPGLSAGPRPTIK